MNPFEPIHSVELQEAVIEPPYPAINSFFSVLSLLLLALFLVFVIPTAVIVWRAAF